MMTTKLTTEAQKITKTVMDTILVTPAECKKWKAPPFQRPIKENAKVFALAEQMKNDHGVWPGVITLCKFGGYLYLIDGQHRKTSFLISGLAEGYVDVRIHEMHSMAELGAEFVRLNSQLVRMGPDDILRGLEPSIIALQIIRDRCPHIGYDSIRRGGDKSPMVSMSTALRCWHGSAKLVPSTASLSSFDLAHATDEGMAAELCEFMHLAFNAFGRDEEYYRMWGPLNLTLCMWLFRRQVGQNAPHRQKYVFLTKDQFQKCMMALTANPVYVDWLQGRHLGERDRSPAYMRMKDIMVKRAQEFFPNTKVVFPWEGWANH